MKPTTYKITLCNGAAHLYTSDLALVALVCQGRPDAKVEEE